MSDVPKGVAFLDTNIHRVLHRVYFGPEVPVPAAKKGELQELAVRLIPAGEGWAWNQAVMEFGALHCTARKPNRAFLSRPVGDAGGPGRCAACHEEGARP